MWLGCQNRRFNCLFWRETRQRILGQKNLAVSGSGKGTRTRVDDATEERELVVGQERGELVAGQEKEQLRQATTEGSGDWTRERRTEKLAWKNGGAVNTRHRAERRGDKIGSSEEESQDV